MKNVLLIIPFTVAVVTAGCVPMYGPATVGRPSYPYRPTAYGPSAAIAPAALPVGRWDNVMMLTHGAAIDVLTADGQRTTAFFVTATNRFVRVQSTGAERDIAADTVIRIDRLYGGPDGRDSVTRDAARGAAVSAGAIGVLGLLVGHAPPARMFAAGAIAGAYENAQMGRALRRSTIIYLAPSASPEALEPDGKH